MISCIFRGLAAWLLYWAGDLVSRWNDNDVRFTETGFALYQQLMLWSSRLQASSTCGPWWKTYHDGGSAL